MKNMKLQSILDTEYIEAQRMRNYYMDKKMEIAKEILAVVKRDYTPELEKRGL